VRDDSVGADDFRQIRGEPGQFGGELRRCSEVFHGQLLYHDRAESDRVLCARLLIRKTRFR
jgi:hypothetical protein